MKNCPYHIQLSQSFQQFTPSIFQTMSLINNKYPPFNITEKLAVSKYHFKGCNQRMEAVDIWYALALKKFCLQVTHKSKE